MDRTRSLLAIAFAVLTVALVVVLRTPEERAPAAGGAADESASATATPVAAPLAAPERLPAFAPPDEAAQEGGATPARPAGERTPTLTVRVRYAADGAPGAELPVHLQAREHDSDPWAPRRTARADAEGVVRFDRLAPGGWYVEVAGGARKFVFLDADAREAEITIEIPPGYAVGGTIVDADGLPIERASIWLSDPWREDRGTVVTKTDARGGFALRDLNGDHALMAYADGHAASASYPLRRGAPPAKPLRITLSRNAGSIEGIVRDSLGQAIAGARMMLGRPDRPHDRRAADGSRIRGPAPRELRSDRAGRFSADSLEPGALPLQVVAHGHAPWRGEAQIRAGETAFVDLRLEPAAAIAGTCRTLGGAAVVARLVAGDDRAFGTARTTADDEGRFRLDGLHGGEVEIVVSAFGYETLRAAIRTAAGATTAWDPVLSPAGVDAASSVAGRVLGVDGRGLGAYQVVAEADPPARGAPVGTRTDSDGRFTLSVPWAVVRLYAYAPGAGPSFPAAHAGGVPQGATGVDLRVDPAEWSALRARILDGRGAPVAASLQVWHETARVWRALSSDPSSGEIALDGIPPGECSLELRSPEHPWLRLGRRTLPPGGVLDLGDIALPNGVRLSGTLRFADGGAPGGRASLTFYDAERREVGVAEVRDGHYRTAPLAAGALTLFVQGEGIAATRRPLQLDERGGDRRLDLTIERGVPVRLRLVPAGGDEGSRAGVTVRIQNRDGTIWMRGVSADHFGRIDASLAPGTYRVVVIGEAPLADLPLQVAGAPLELTVPLLR